MLLSHMNRARNRGDHFSLGGRIMRTASIGIVVGVAMLTAACASVSVNTDYNSEAISSMSAYQGYAWLPHPQGGDTRANNDLVATRVVNAVDEALAASGYRKAQQDADFLVGWHLSLEGKIDVTTVNRYYGYGYGRWRGGAVVVGQTTSVREYDEGTLIIDIVDAASNELVWRGTAQGEIKANATGEQRSERVRSVVQQILEDFPPQPGG